MTALRRNRIIDHRIVKGRDLLPNPANWRTHPPDQRAATTAVLDRLGYVDELKAVETPGGLMLMDGHLRADIGADDDIPVAIVDLAPDEQTIFLATFDPLAAMAITDHPAFEALADTIVSEDEAIMRLLEGVRDHTPLLLGDLLEKDEEATARGIQKIAGEGYKVIAQTGQTWQLGRHRLYCGDAADVAVLIGDTDIALTLTDPPYGIGIVRGVKEMASGATGDAKPFGRTTRQPGGAHPSERRGKVWQGGKRKGSHLTVEPRLYMPVRGDDQPFDPTALLALGRNQVIFGGAYFAQRLPERTAWLCWDKGISVEATFSGFELAWTSFPGRYRLYRHLWSGMMRAGPRDIELADRVHPTQKPVAVLEAILRDFSAAADAICDPYIGSGSTLIACERTDRTCYAVEIEPRYCDVVIQRWEAYTGGKAELQG
jgi:hypothetical protein